MPARGLGAIAVPRRVGLTGPQNRAIWHDSGMPIPRKIPPEHRPVSTTPSRPRSARTPIAAAPSAVRNRPACLVAAALFLAAVAGCSVKGYDWAYGLATEHYRLQALVKPGNVSLEGTRLIHRVPKVTAEEDVLAQAPWATPPFMRDIPGIRTAYRGWVDAGDSKLPVTLTVGMLTDDEFDAEKVKRDISAAVREDANFGKAAWEDFDHANQKLPNLGELQWSRLKLSGKQPFEITVAGNPEEKNIEGITECWVGSHSENKVLALFVWRVPAEVMDRIKFDRMTQFISGQVLTGPRRDPPAEPAPAAAEPAPAAAPAAAK